MIPAEFLLNLGVCHRLEGDRCEPIEDAVILTFDTDWREFWDHGIWAYCRLHGEIELGIRTDSHPDLKEICLWAKPQ